MALFNECMQSCVHIVLDTADIVRDGDVSTATALGLGNRDESDLALRDLTQATQQ